MARSPLAHHPRIGAAAALMVATLVVPLAIHAAATERTEGPPAGPTTLPGHTFVAAPPPGDKGPDDITRLTVDGLNHGRPVIWTAYQNGIGPDGSPAGAQSTVAGYDQATAALVETIAVTGKVDGLSADPASGRLIASVNEDSNSALNVIDTLTGGVTPFRYDPDPAAQGAGGTDSVAVHGGHILVTHSNPADTTQAAEFQVTLDEGTHTARLHPVFSDNSQATDAVTGRPVALGLTDPDTNAFMPVSAPRFAERLATVSQGDGQIVFGTAPGELSVLSLTDNVAGNVPPADGLTTATAESGTLYVVDAKTNAISALDTTGWAAGTVFIGEADDNGNPLIGVLDLSTGKITPLGNTFQNPKGLLFVAADE